MNVSHALRRLDEMQRHSYCLGMRAPAILTLAFVAGACAVTSCDSTTSGGTSTGGQSGSATSTGGDSGDTGGGGAGGGGAGGFCNNDNDCVFRRDAGCCGACLATVDVPMPMPGVCTGACLKPPGGCSCVEHACTRGILKEDDPCDRTQDACGSGFKCCQLCGALTAPTSVPFLESCALPTCLQSVMDSSGSWDCMQLVSASP